MLEERENEWMVFREEGKGRKESFYMRESVKMGGGIERKVFIGGRERETKWCLEGGRKEGV